MSQKCVVWVRILLLPPITAQVKGTGIPDWLKPNRLWVRLPPCAPWATDGNWHTCEAQTFAHPGSNPGLPTKHGELAERLLQQFAKLSFRKRRVGSNPTLAAKLLLSRAIAGNRGRSGQTLRRGSEICFKIHDYRVYSLQRKQDEGNQSPSDSG
jgi:hypothetical protein